MYERPGAVNQRKESTLRILNPVYHPIGNPDHHSGPGGYGSRTGFIQSNEVFCGQTRIKAIRSFATIFDH
jgi:hypothetical protein